MIIWYTLTGTTLCVFLLSLARYLTLRRIHSSPSRKNAAQNGPFFTVRPRKKNFVVGILTPLANESALFLEQGLHEQLDQHSTAQYQIRSFHGNNDRVTLFSHAKTILKECDILIPFGLACSNISYEAARHLQSSKPIVFSGLRSSHIPLLKRYNPSTTLSGIVSRSNHLSHLSQLHTLKPKMKSILILYRQQHEWLINDVFAMKEYLENHGITATPHLLAHGTHIDNQLSAIARPFDTIMLMPHTLNAKGVNELVTYCNIKGVTLSTHEADAVSLGAAIGFAGREVAIGSSVGRMIRDTLEIEKEYKQETFVEHIDHTQVHLNARALSKQNVPLSPEILFLLSQADVTHDTKQVSGLQATLSTKTVRKSTAPSPHLTQPSDRSLSRFLSGIKGGLH